MNINTYDRLLDLGFSEKEIEDMKRKFKHTLNISPTKAESVYYKLIEIGLTRENAHYFLFDTPSIFGKAISTIENQFNLYQNIFGLNYLEFIIPKRLLQGYDTTQKRYVYLKDRIKTLEEMNENLFLGKKQFKKKFNSDL